MAVTLRKQQVIDSYAVVIENGRGLSQKFLNSIEQYLKNADMPNVTYGREQVVTSVANKLFGKGREYIVVRHRSLPEFIMFISARDYGNYLDITWALTLNPGFLRRQFSKTMTGSGYGLTFRSLDLFTQQELDAYTVIVHRAVTDTAKRVYQELSQDFSKVNTRSRSGLAAW